MYMKKFLKSRLFFFILGVLVCLTSTVLAYSYFANEVGFTPTDEYWSVDNTKKALDWLYNFEAKKAVDTDMISLSPTSSSVLYRVDAKKNMYSKYKIRLGWHQGDNCNASEYLIDDTGTTKYTKEILYDTEYIINRTYTQVQLHLKGNGSWCNITIDLYN